MTLQLERNQLLYLDVMKRACHRAPGRQSTRKQTRYTAARGAFKPLNRGWEGEGCVRRSEHCARQRGQAKERPLAGIPRLQQPAREHPKASRRPFAGIPGSPTAPSPLPRDREGLGPHHNVPAAYSRRGETAQRREAAPCAQARAREAAAQPARPTAGDARCPLSPVPQCGRRAARDVRPASAAVT